jgi:gliding motility-associated-like protein
VLLHTNTIAGNLTIDVHGGRGGDNNTHGTGGGGGGGVVWSNIALPSNVTLNLSGGQPGFHTSTNSNHGAAPGGNGGVITGLSLPESSVPFSPLPKPLAVAPTQVCEGESIQFSVNAIPNVSYSWIGPNGFTSTQQNPIIANASTLASGDYIVIVQNSLGCVQRDTVTVSVRPKYLQTVNVNICQGASYTRPNGVSVSNPGTYRDTLQAVGGCDSIIVTHLTVTSFSLQTGNDTSICIGRSVQMAATGGSYYRWRPATALSDTTIANPIATPTQTTQYIVTAYEPSQNLIINGDFESGNTGFTTDYVYSSPNPLQPPGHYTVGTFVSNYWWSGCTDHTTGSGNMLLVDGADGSNGVPIGANVWCQSVNVLPNRDYVFSTWLTNLNTTGSTSQLRLLINGIPIGPVQNTPLAPCQWNQFYVLWNSANHTTANICITETSGAQPGNDFALDDISFALLCYQTDTVTISVNPPDTTVVNREICSGSNYVLPNGTSVNTAGSYTTTLLNSKGCDSVIITHLTINPVFRDTIVASICQGKSYTLPNGNITTATGTYNSLLQTAKGCDSLVTTILNVLPNSLTIVDTIICPNTNFTRPSGVVVNVPGTYSDTLIAANGCDSVITTHLRLHPVYAQTITDTICIGNTYTLPDGNIVSQSGTYLISLATVNGCDSLFTVNLSVLNVLATATTTEAKCFGGSDGSIAVNATGGVSPYNFSINTGAVQTGISSTTFSNLMAGSYDIEIADANGCTAQVTATVNEPTQLILSASSADATCFGAADGKVQLQATGGKIPYQYSLNNTSNDNGMFNKLSAGNYTATVRDVNNCTATYSFIISEPDEILITATPNPSVLKLGAKDSIRLSSNYSNINYNWSPLQGLDCNYCNTVTVSPLTHTTYRVKGNVLINGSYCEAETYVDVIVEADYSTYVPNTFSPNNDGINDFFEWYGNKQAVKLIEVQIFNRWGEKVFESNDVNFRWDGTYLGSDAPVGIYIYLLKITWLDGFTDNRYKGSLMLVR